MKKLICSTAALGCLLISPPASGQVLMLDFGSTTVGSPSLTNSPYHTVNPFFTNTSWNKIQTADVSSLLWSDGSAAEGLTLDLGGRPEAGGTAISLATTPSSSALGNSVNTGVYADTSVGKDGIFVGSSSGQDRAVGFQLGGLAAGLYDVYVTARNTSTNNPYFQMAYVGTSAAAGVFDYGAYDSATLNYSANSATSAWEEGSNYVKFTVDLAAGNYLNLAVTGVGSANEMRGFLNSVQIVAVPEPGVAVLLAAAGVCVLWRFRRGRSA